MTEEARYILAKKIARGGMAEIYLGKHVGQDGFQRLCAIKRILPHYAQDQEFIQMFRDEAHICKRLQHANIVRVEGFEEVDGSYAIIMEFVDGSDLRSILHATEQAKKRVPLPVACHIIAEAARGLHYAHTKVDEITQQPLGIVHRDISPQNILVSFEGEVKITDFGIADAESKITETRPGIVKGKYSYMSPEQISAKAVDARTDIFALSIVLWEMLAMRRLFQGDNEVDTIQRVKNCRIEKELKDLNSEVDDELDQIVKRGLAKDPKKRYKTAADFEKDLRRYMSRRFPDFTPEDLGNTIKKTLDTKRAESAADIKKTLTETSLRPGRSKSGGGKNPADLSIEVPQNLPALTLAKPATQATASTNTFSHRSSTQNHAPASRSATGLHRPGYTPNRPRPQPVLQKRKMSTKSWLLATLPVLVIVVAGTILQNLHARSKPAILRIRTQPERVKIWVDREPVNQGRYVDTADGRATFPVEPGKRVIWVQRDGYQRYEYDFVAENGTEHQKDDIILKPRLRLAAIKIVLRSASKAGRIIISPQDDLQDFYFIDNFEATQTKELTPDLHTNKEYAIRLIPKNTKGETFQCRFTPKSNDWKQPTEIMIDLRTRKCMQRPR